MRDILYAVEVSSPDDYEIEFNTDRAPISARCSGKVRRAEAMGAIKREGSGNHSAFAPPALPEIALSADSAFRGDPNRSIPSNCWWWPRLPASFSRFSRWRRRAVERAGI